ncbi:hypothetical protein BT63DRAFT_426436 [Microthyrium microscopicum]|uniref:Uncharacterized protein n=1 Tax=Microthyrium microscopicum TaxID=703497 RepID=A0A6A6U8E9_9PEZI|nr:hypothetical protein BT63DRAFT_426436 [Microthyrium microscopicum]
MAGQRIIALATLLLVGRTIAQDTPAARAESYNPVVDWGNQKVETYSSLSTFNRLAVEDTTQPPPASAPPATTAPPVSATPPASSAPPASAPPAQSPGSQPPASAPKSSVPTSSAPKGPSSTTKPGGSSTSGSTRSSPTSSYSFSPQPLPAFATSSSVTPPDVLLQVPTIGVKRIELDVDNLQVDINLNAQVANLVTVNAGVYASITKVNLTISDVGAELELVVRLGHLADIINRVFQSLDLNPLLIATINNVTNILDNVIGQVDGLLGSITRGGTVLNFLIDNLGNIVQQVVSDAGQTVNSIVGNYQQNMTYTGKSQMLPNNLIQKTYKYGPLNALVNIVFNAAGQLVSAVVGKQDSGGGGGNQGTAPPAQSGSPAAAPAQPAQPQANAGGGAGAKVGGGSR